MKTMKLIVVALVMIATTFAFTTVYATTEYDATDSSAEETVTCEHDYSSKITTKPTCRNTGVRTYTCDYCGDNYTREIPIVKHEYASKVILKAKCDRNGKVKCTCKYCGKYYYRTTNRLGHKYKSKIVKKATCLKEGKRKYKCERCNKRYYKPIKKLAHKYKYKTVKKATCTRDGKRKRTCERCRKHKAFVITKLGHDYKKNAILAATCTTKGKMKLACARCTSVKYQPIEKKEHYPQKHEGKFRCRDCKASIPELSKNQKAILARADAVSWAIRIANNNDFHYGKSKWAHHNGCYYCGTNQSEDSIKRRAGAKVDEALKTYCCNPFVTAAYCHGAKAVEVDCKESSMRFGLANDPNKVLHRTHSWKKIDKPSSVYKLVKGDILFTPTHCMIYAGDGKVVHAAHHDNGVRDDYWDNSIVYEAIPDRQWKRTTKIYRYTGTGKY